MNLDFFKFHLSFAIHHLPLKKEPIRFLLICDPGRNRVERDPGLILGTGNLHEFKMQVY